MTSEKRIAEVTDHPPTMVQRGKRTGVVVNGFVSQEGLLPVLELPRQLDQQASCLKDQGG